MPSFRRSMPKWNTPERYNHNRTRLPRKLEGPRLRLSDQGAPKALDDGHRIGALHVKRECL